VKYKKQKNTKKKKKSNIAEKNKYQQNKGMTRVKCSAIGKFTTRTIHAHEEKTNTQHTVHTYCQRVSYL
jgi:hypothetical protein